MKVAVFSIHKFEKDYLLNANAGKHDLAMIEARLTEKTSMLAEGCEAICIFTGDDASAPVLKTLHALGIKYLALRSAGVNHVDLITAKGLGMKAARVPAYSPYAIAEHAVALMLALNRKIVSAHNRIRELNFSLNGLVGFDMNGKTAGIVGTGKIGSVLVRILHGFGCRLLAYDLHEDEALMKNFGLKYLDFKSLCEQSDIISLQLPLTEQTKYMIDQTAISWMKPGVMLINTSRGGLVNTKAVIEALKTRHIGSFGMDVYEEEEGLFFEDHSENILQDDVIARLMTFKNVLITSHQAFLTDTALTNIADTTIHNLNCFEQNLPSGNEVV